MVEHFVVGIDVGMATTKVVVLGSERPGYESVTVKGGIDSSSLQISKAIHQACEQAGIPESSIDRIVATGTGKDEVTQAERRLSEFICLAKGINYFLPSIRTLVDLGARKSLAIKCQDGKVSKMATSSKCASGTGIYLEVVANLLSIRIDEIDDLFFDAEHDLEIQSPCAVFVESEIISLVHNGVQTADIVAGVIRGLAGRLYSQLLDIGIEKELSVSGGMANSRALINALEKKIGTEIRVPADPTIVGALGAAIIGMEMGGA